MEQLAEDMLKETFVTAWLRYDDPYRAAHEVFPSDTKAAMAAAVQWPKDLTVLEYKAALLSADEAAGIPSRAEFARDVYLEFKKQSYWEAKVAFGKLFAEVRGYIAKPGTVINNNLTQNKVMVVTSHGNDDAWEASLSKNQKRLQSG